MAAADTSLTALGIDLGHSNACIGLFRGGEVQIIANEQGSRSTPSLLAFNERELHIGEAAQSQLAINLTNTIHHIKKILGLRYEDSAVAEIQSRVDYRIENENGFPVIVVDHKGETVKFTPTQLVTILLTKLKSVADRFSGVSMDECVMAAPAFFTDKQIEALIEAGNAAGLKVLSVLNEAVAAAMAFDLDKLEVAPKRAQHVVVVDVGGATSTVTLMSVESGRFIERHHVTDIHLGGDDLDAKLVAHFAHEFKKRTNLDLTGNHRSMTRLTLAVEHAKRVLSSSTQAAIECDSIFEGEDLFSNITRAKFESLCAPLFRKITGLVTRCISESGLTNAQVEHVLMIGGSARIPRLFEMVKTAVSREPQRLSNPEEAVAQGCAIQASLLAHRGDEWRKALADTAAGTKKTKCGLRFSIGIEGDDGVTQRILFKRQPLPAIAQIELKLPVGNEPFVLNLVEGEHASAALNHSLGSLVLHNRTESELTVKAVVMVNEARDITVTAQGEKLVLNASLPNTLMDEAKLAALESTNDSDNVYRSLSASRSALIALINEAEASLGSNQKGRSLLEDARSWLAFHPVLEAALNDDIFADKRQSLDEAIDQLKTDLASHPTSNGAHHDVDVDDLDDYMARANMNGHSYGDEGEHTDIADLD